MTLLLGVFLIPLTWGQELQVKGEVFADNGEQLSGVNIQIKGINRGTQSDFDGYFEIKVEEGQWLLFSFVGFDDYTVQVQDQTELEVVMQRNTALEEIVILGSRTGARSRLESAVPVDAFDVQKFTERTGEGSLSHMLNAAIPSFSAVTHSRLGLTDHVDPASLRGMSPGQTLVLLNQKRLHPSSIVNIVGGTNMGSVGTDLNIIPSFAVQKIEVLRDGASSQYGSDAIAGVVDLQMKRNTDGLTGQISYGGRLTKEARNFQGDWDGDRVQVDLNYGTKLGDKGGFLNLTGSYQYQGRTYRSMETDGQIFNVYNAVYQRAFEDGIDLDRGYGNINGLQGQEMTQFIDQLKGYAGEIDYLDASLQNQIQSASGINELQGLFAQDVSDPELAYRNLERRDFSLNVGQTKINSVQLFFNTEIPLTAHTKLYGFGGYNFRNTSAMDYTKYPYQTSLNVPSLFPLGYQPLIISDIHDYTVTAGIKGSWGKWNYDFSNTLGENILKLRADNTTNVSLQHRSPTDMRIGEIGFLQNTMNLDFKRYFDVWAGLNVAFGAEYRHEDYRIKSGQEEAYEAYDLNGNIVTESTLDLERPTDFFGNILPGANQGRGGSNPSNEVDKGRDSFALYGEAEANFTDWLLVDGALRYEHYSDFGNTANFKIASRIKLAPYLNFRMAGSTGFRAPSMAQIYYNTTSTLLLNGIGRKVGLFRNDSDVAKALGIPQLKEEKSRSFTAGFTYRIPDLNLSFTADAFIINVRDQIILTGTFAAPSGPNLTPAQQELQAVFARQNIDEAQFFANAIDVETKGLDFVASHQYTDQHNFAMTTNLGLNLNRVKRVGNIHSSDLLRDAGLEGSYFDEHAKTYLEASAPRIKMNLMNDISLGKWNVFLQNSYYGKVWGADNENINQLPYIHTPHSGRVLTDLSVTYPLTDQLLLTVGSNNIFDVHQTKNVPSLAFHRQFPYDVRVSQFDLEGRFVFARLNFKL